MLDITYGARSCLPDLGMEGDDVQLPVLAGGCTLPLERHGPWRSSYAIVMFLWLIGTPPPRTSNLRAQVVALYLKLLLCQWSWMLCPSPPRSPQPRLGHQTVWPNRYVAYTPYPSQSLTRPRPLVPAPQPCATTGLQPVSRMTLCLCVPMCHARCRPDPAPPRIAALCHDLGHGPASHGFDRFLQRMNVKDWWVRMG